MSFYNPKTQAEIEQSMLSTFSTLKPDVTIKTSSLPAMILKTVSYFEEETEFLVSDLGNEMSLPTATGQRLDDLAINFNFSRIVANKAMGTINFSRLTPSLIDIIIPQGTVVQTIPDANGQYKSFITTAEATLLQDTFQIDVPAEAVIGGLEGNVLGSTQASLITGTGNAMAVFTTKIAGAIGDEISIEIVNTGTLGITVSNSVLTININEGTTTVAQVKATVEANTTANNLVLVGYGTGDGTGAIVAMAETYLSGGIDGEIEVLSSYVANIDFITNKDTFLYGLDEESDDDFRQRVQEGLKENTAVGTLSGYERTARKVAGVKTAKCITNEARIATLSSGTGASGLIFKAKSFGAYGNSLKVACVNGGSLSVAFATDTLTITLVSGTTTASAVKSAIEASVVANAIFTVEYPYGQTGSGTFATFSATNLSGGLGVNGVAPNEILLYITEDNTTGIPSNTLIESVQNACSIDSVRCPADIINVLSPTPVDIIVSCYIVEYEASANQDNVKLAVQSALIEYVSSLAVGEKVYLQGLRTVVHNTDGVIDFSILLPSSNEDIDITEKARLTVANCSIT